MSRSEALSVSELTSRIKAILEGGLPALWVRGEISQFTRHRSGHWYFTLSDERSLLPCVMWRGRTAEVAVVPEVGQQVLVQGKVTVYERGGKYQFDCFEIRPAGAGELALAFEALKRKLDAEGLFDLQKKVPLPSLPERVGLVTSPDGAALQDILRVARKRAPWVEFTLAPAAVQGTSAPGEIVASIRVLDERGDLDLIIVSRGGGAPEDLWAFNDEKVVRAVAECRTPIVSAVGHEVDVTLSDLAADVRAPTPSAAAEICLPDRDAIKARLEELRSDLVRILEREIGERRKWLTERAGRALQQRLLSLWKENSLRLDETARRLDAGALLFLERCRSKLDRLAARHRALDPLAVLARGYAVVRHTQRRKPVISAAELAPQDLVDITFHRGGAQAVVKRCRLDGEG